MKGPRLGRRCCATLGHRGAAGRSALLQHAQRALRRPVVLAFQPSAPADLERAPAGSCRRPPERTGTGPARCGRSARSCPCRCAGRGARGSDARRGWGSRPPSRPGRTAAASRAGSVRHCACGGWARVPPAAARWAPGAPRSSPLRCGLLLEAHGRGSSIRIPPPPPH